MSLARALLWAIVACLPVCAIAASEPDCPTGPFETDPDAIALSFLFEPADSDMVKVAESDPRMALAIAVTRSGAQWHSSGGFLSEGSESWQAYDAERHVFISVGFWRPRQAQPDSDAARTTAGATSSAVTIARATPDQARQFACLANAIANRYAAWDLARPQLPAEADPRAASGGLVQVTVAAHAIPNQVCTVASDAFMQTLFFRKDGHWFPSLCDANSVRMKEQLLGLVDRALAEARQLKAKNSPQSNATPDSPKPFFVDPYAGRKLDFVH
jgi:hypothetical protein